MNNNCPQVVSKLRSPVNEAVNVLQATNSQREHGKKVSRVFYSEGSTAEVGQEEENGQVQVGNGGGQEGESQMDNGLSSSSVPDVDEETAEEMENVLSSESEAPISERAASGFSDSPPVGSPRVQFKNIKEEDVPASKEDEAPAVAQPAGHDEDRKCRRHQKHEHK